MTIRMTQRQRMGLAGAALLAVGAAAGAGAVSLTRPTVEMAPTMPTVVSRLAATGGIVTVRGQVVAVYGDRFLVRDRTGQVLVDAGRRGAATLGVGSPVLVQGRFDDGQLRARFLVDRSGTIEEVGPRGPHHGHDGPPPPHGGPDGGPPPPAGLGTPPPPSAAMDTPPPAPAASAGQARPGVPRAN